jgi:hypothetical protein
MQKLIALLTTCQATSCQQEHCITRMLHATAKDWQSISLPVVKSYNLLDALCVVLKAALVQQYLVF